MSSRKITNRLKCRANYCQPQNCQPLLRQVHRKP